MILDREANYRARLEHIVQEHIDDETIIINMESGSYFSLRATATEIWSHLLNGASPSSLVNELAIACDTDHDNVQSGVEQFLAGILDGGLIEVCDDNKNAHSDISFKTQAYSAPAFEVYSDVQDLLLLDPIHDVSDAGWPENQPADSKKLS